MAVVFSDNFDGYADGTPIDATKYKTLWYPITQAGQLTYQGGELQVLNGAYASQAMAFPRALQGLADLDITVRYKVITRNSSDSAVVVWLRSNDDAYTSANQSISRPQNGLAVMWESPSATTRYLRIRMEQDGASTVLASLSGAPQAVNGTEWALRVRLEGRRVQVKLWNTASAEPTSWTLDATASEAQTQFPTAGAAVGFGADVWSSARWTITDVAASDLTAAPGAVPDREALAWTGTEWAPLYYWDGGQALPLRGPMKIWDGATYVDAV